MTTRKLISIVTPCYNEEDNVETTYTTARKIMEEQLGEYEYEHIFSDNASTDRTVELLARIAEEDKRVKVVVNLRNIGPFRKNFHALKHTRGDAVLVMLPADLQDPPELIPELVRHWEDGYKVVFGLRAKREEAWWLADCEKYIIAWWNSCRRSASPRMPANFSWLTASWSIRSIKLTIIIPTSGANRPNRVSRHRRVIHMAPPGARGFQEPYGAHDRSRVKRHYFHLQGAHAVVIPLGLFLSVASFVYSMISSDRPGYSAKAAGRNADCHYWALFLQRGPAVFIGILGNMCWPSTKTAPRPACCRGEENQPRFEGESGASGPAPRSAPCGLSRSIGQSLSPFDSRTITACSFAPETAGNSNHPYPGPPI